jgi:hypothetical protein
LSQLVIRNAIKIPVEHKFQAIKPAHKKTLSKERERDIFFKKSCIPISRGVVLPYILLRQADA